MSWTSSDCADVFRRDDSSYARRGVLFHVLGASEKVKFASCSFCFVSKTSDVCIICILRKPIRSEQHLLPSWGNVSLIYVFFYASLSRLLDVKRL